ncbi:MAG: hypothetical protein U1E18_21485 [Brevundimonas sp.]|uniref:hypothetical protein n=1 Tax=Brevundimonas sp. TaxID=1871086 RepID=UPI002AB917B0|nr:hypothetical protein [Brevundimonas sp.]MDZ4112149.1 hypothetical protein [Brevundimonas sp.]
MARQSPFVARLAIALGAAIASLSIAVATAMGTDFVESITTWLFNSSPIFRYATYVIAAVALFLILIIIALILFTIINSFFQITTHNSFNIDRRSLYKAYVDSIKTDPDALLLASSYSGLTIFAKRDGVGWALSYARMTKSGEIDERRPTASNVTVIFGVTPTRALKEQTLFSIWKAAALASLPYLTTIITTAIAVRSNIRLQANKELSEKLSDLTSAMIRGRQPAMDKSQADLFNEINKIVEITGKFQFDGDPSIYDISIHPNASSIWGMDYALLMNAIFKMLSPDSEGRLNLQMRVWNPFIDWKMVADS